MEFVLMGLYVYLLVGVLSYVGWITSKVIALEEELTENQDYNDRRAIRLEFNQLDIKKELTKNQFYNDRRAIRLEFNQLDIKKELKDGENFTNCLLDCLLDFLKIDHEKVPEKTTELTYAFKKKPKTKE